MRARAELLLPYPSPSPTFCPTAPALVMDLCLSPQLPVSPGCQPRACQSAPCLSPQLPWAPWVCQAQGASQALTPLQPPAPPFGKVGGSKQSPLTGHCERGPWAGGVGPGNWEA